ncbi:MAG TPA: MarR family transcriptional regulator [Solirubrobacteraceae bacterium]|nr:MarR family transcriptional regulator [Solirubrobacteraceae bacterium]
MWIGAPIPPELGVFPGYLLARLGETSRRRFAEVMGPTGLDGRHFRVLTIVGVRPGMTQQQLHEKTSIDPSSMVAVIDELETRGFAERRQDPDDGRARTIFLTPAGERFVRRITRLATELQDELLAPLDKHERVTLHTLLRKLTGSEA